MTIQELIDILQEYAELEGDKEVVATDDSGRQFDVDAAGMSEDGDVFEVYI